MARNKNLNVRFNEQEYNELQYLSDSNGISMSDLIRQSVKSNLNKSQTTNIGCTINNFNAPTQINNNRENKYDYEPLQKPPASTDGFLDNGAYYLDINQ